MVLVYILLLIPLIAASMRFDEPSYRSNVMDGGKPILRMAPEADETESDVSDENKRPSSPQRKAPESAKNMNRLVNWLIDNFSYDLVVMGRKNNDGLREGDKPIDVPSEAPDETNESNSDEKEGDKPILGEGPNESNASNSGLREGDEPILGEGSYESDASNSDRDEDRVIQKLEAQESEPLTESPVDLSEEPPVESKENGLRSHKKKKHKEAKVDPEWVTDLKDYIKDLTTRYGQHEVLNKTKPIIASLEKKHHMKIKDIDVDEYGEIHITYLEKGKKTARKRKDRG